MKRFFFKESFQRVFVLVKAHAHNQHTCQCPTTCKQIETFLCQLNIVKGSERTIELWM